MSRDKDYQRLLNSRRWKELRQWKLQHNPLCEMCEAEGKVVAAIDIHHIRPVAGNLREMERLCFDPCNLQSLCIDHHIEVHQRERSHTKAAHQARQSEVVDRWLAKHQQKKNPAGSFCGDQKDSEIHSP